MAKVGAKEETIDWVAIRYVINDAVKMAFTAKSGLAFQDASDEISEDDEEEEDDDEIIDDAEVEDAEDEYFSDVFRVESIRLITVGSFLFAKITKLDGQIEFIPYHKIEAGYSQMAADERF